MKDKFSSWSKDILNNRLVRCWFVQCFQHFFDKRGCLIIVGLICHTYDNEILVFNTNFTEKANKQSRCTEKIPHARRICETWSRLLLSSDAHGTYFNVAIIRRMGNKSEHIGTLKKSEATNILEKRLILTFLFFRIY